MRIVILAAGYATGLYPLTLTRPKPLLTVGDRPMIDRVLENLSPIQGVTHVYVVTNHKFAGLFQEWVEQTAPRYPEYQFRVVDDGSTEDANKLGAVGDLQWVLSSEKIDDDVLVVAGDNLFNKPLGDFGRFCVGKNAPVLGIYDVQTIELARKYGVVTVDKEGRIAALEEKPEDPPSTFIGFALYF